MSKLRQRLASEKGFTLIELLVVLVIIGILLAIAVPSYLGFKDRANNSAAKANLRAALPSAEAYYADNNTYATMTPALLQAIDSGLSKSIAVVAAATNATQYCLTETVGNATWSVKGPGPGAADWHNNATCT
jgi:type IV pilus assembly protein PilA